MSPRLPAVTARQAIAALQRAGFVLERTSGSHRLFVHRDDSTRIVIVPFHAGRDLKTGTLRNILRQARLTVDEFQELL